MNDNKKNITQESSYDLRYTIVNDELCVRKWLYDLSVRKWYPPSSELDVDVFVRNWIGFFKYNASLTAVYNNEVVGVATIFLMPYKKVAHTCMMYMAVNPNYYHIGIGASLLRNIKNLAKMRFSLEFMDVEIWEGAPIMKLLKENGFKEIAKQDNFVKLDDGFRARYVMEVEL